MQNNWLLNDKEHALSEVFIVFFFLFGFHLTCLSLPAAALHQTLMPSLENVKRSKQSPEQTQAQMD